LSEERKAELEENQREAIGDQGNSPNFNL